ncbi:MAG: hypothetical protein V3T03_03840 [Candidatus Bipolaricaulota bacterium]
MPEQAVRPHIGTLNEKPLHASLKAWISEPGDEFEVRIGRFVADIVRGSLLIEIQTGSTFPLKRKLNALLKHHAVHLVIPIAQQKTIITIDEIGDVVSTRKSPKRGELLDVFNHLVHLRELLGDANFSIEALLIHVEEIRRPRTTRKRRWRDWEVQERRLIEVFDHASFHHPGDYLAAIPSTLEEPFTTADLSKAIGRPRRVAQQIAYCLREMGALAVVDRKREGIRYVRSFNG